MDQTAPHRSADAADRVKATIDARVAALRLSQRGFARAAGVSYATFENVRHSRTTPRPATEHKLERVLGWAPDSIQRIREGHEPVLLNEPASAGTPSPAGAPPPLNAPSEPGFRALPRSDGSGITDYWLTEMVDGDPVSVHIPAGTDQSEEKVRKALTQAIQHMKVAWGLR
ncbi:hypothetical protein ACFOVU_10925 [Nocardiopsis sediminis]|uniref:XRE family transcriptional regulator n=1 Tax=Nocardiopsis sediminis TaxID=1778267 RepID=A0ABV8FN79_9ACTN